jgi:hypothetical protein
MIDKKKLFQIIDVPLRAAGYKKKGLSWYLDGKEVLIVVNFQRSNWGPLYYINVGFCIKALSEDSFPKYYHCHLCYRIEAFFPKQRDLILKACDLELSNSEMLVELSDFFSNQMIPFLKECTYEDKLRKMFAQGMLKNGRMQPGISDYLSSE